MALTIQVGDPTVTTFTLDETAGLHREMSSSSASPADVEAAF